MKKLRVLDLFSGIGGFSLGLERTGGFETVAFCEIEEFPRRVLAKHWPEVPVYEDVTLSDFGHIGPVDLVTGGFPCQDVSHAGAGAGLAGERSGLFWHILRAAGMVGRPKLLLENVAALLGRGMGEVLGALAQIGYDAEWHCIPASAVGAPHERDRVWIIADPNGMREPQQEGRFCYFGRRLGDMGEKMADAMRIDEQGQQQERLDQEKRARQVRGPAGPCCHGLGWWAAEPGVGRVAHGIRDRSHRNKSLGNAVIPQIPELIGRAVLEAAQ